MPPADETWPEAIATVLECHYDMRVGRALVGIPSGKNFRIRYNYYADGETHEGQMYSATAMPQNTLFPIRYNPSAPKDHTQADGTPANSRIPLMVFGVIGSLVLSLAWLFLLRGCGAS
jgi:hypothetical protein